MTDGGPLFDHAKWYIDKWAKSINLARDMTDATYALDMILMKIPEVPNIHQRKNRASEYRKANKGRRDWVLGDSLDKAKTYVACM